MQPRAVPALPVFVYRDIDSTAADNSRAKPGIGGRQRIEYQIAEQGGAKDLSVIERRYQ